MVQAFHLYKNLFSTQWLYNTNYVVLCDIQYRNFEFGV